MNWELVLLFISGWLFYGFVVGILAFYIDPEKKGDVLTLSDLFTLSLAGVVSTAVLIFSIFNYISLLSDKVIFRR